MKVGSIVQLTRDDWDLQRMKDLSRFGVRYPIKNKDYTVREITPSHKGVACILLEEIVNPTIPFEAGASEPLWRMSRFKELMGPVSINIEELLSVEA